MPLTKLSILISASIIVIMSPMTTGCAAYLQVQVIDQARNGRTDVGTRIRIVIPCQNN